MAVSCDASDLSSLAKCLGGLSDLDLMRIEVYLLCQIVNNGGGGGGGSSGVTCGLVDPVAAPTGSCGLYLNQSTGSLWGWDGSAWFALIT